MVRKTWLQRITRWLDGLRYHAEVRLAHPQESTRLKAGGYCSNGAGEAWRLTLGGERCPARCPREWIRESRIDGVSPLFPQPAPEYLPHGCLRQFRPEADMPRDLVRGDMLPHERDEFLCREGRILPDDVQRDDLARFLVRPSDRRAFEYTG